MINIKTDKEIELIIKACNILKEAKKVVYDAIKVGVNVLDLDKMAHDKIIELGGQPAFLGYQNFPKTACISINEEVIHGIPKNRKIQDGDVVKVDLGVKYQGYYSDSAFTKIVGKCNMANKKIVEVAENAFWEGVNAIKPGARIGDISHAIEQYIRKNGLFTPKEFSGHGIGKNLHEDPYVPNEGKKGTGPKLEDNMVICIEPIILQGSSKIKIAYDKWTVISLSNLPAAHYEHTILIKDGYPIILTEGI